MILSTTNANVNKKADATALNALSNRVTQTEKDINSQADSITSLNSTLNINARKGSNPWLDGTFETYDVNQNLVDLRELLAESATRAANACA